MSSSNFDTGKYLIERGVKPSYQRIRVFEYLYNNRNHPTVDEIYKCLVTEIPTLSKTTVYNILKLFLEKKIIQLIFIEENQNRYDADISEHGHFKCDQCGKVYDFNVDMSCVKTYNLEEFRINEKQLYFRGTCKECLNINKSIKNYNN